LTPPIRVRGATLPAAFAEMARAALPPSIAPDTLEERDVREVRAHGATVEDLLANWINECLYVHEVEAFAWRRVEFAVFDVERRSGAEPMRVHSFLHGEEIALSDDRSALASLSATSVGVRPLDGGWEIEVVPGPNT
jgi:SHS2 domain-containing protein